MKCSLVADGCAEDNRKTAASRGQGCRQQLLLQLNEAAGGRQCLRRHDIAMVMVIFAGQSALVIRPTTISRGTGASAVMSVYFALLNVLSVLSVPRELVSGADADVSRLSSAQAN